MDFGFTLDGLGFLGSSDNGFCGLGLSSEVETRPKGFGSGCLKQGRSGLMEDEWRNQQGSLKMAKSEDFSVSKGMLLQPRPTLLRSNSLFPEGQLNFSVAKSEAGLIANDGLDRSLQATLPYYNHSVYARSSDLGSGSLNNNMHGGLAGIRGPFTPSQWLELEHQALIFKYLTANVPVPATLIIPIRKSLNPTGFSGFSTGSLRPNSLGWGSFHMGFSGNPDPEPGRCRRTDGKKWRCSRDAVADQKYCERHMNRGRHRSRKPVEGQTGHVAAKALPPVSSSLATASGGGATDNLAIAQQIKSLQPAPDPSATNFSRFLINKQNVETRMRDSQSLLMLPSTNLKSTDPHFPLPKNHLSFEEQRPRMELESLLNPQKNSYFQTRNFATPSNLNARESSQAQSFRHFIDDWPKTRPDRPTISWPNVEEIQTDRTQLSISIPVASSDFSSSSSSPPQEKITLSPLKFSRELDLIQMGLGVGALTESTQRQANWIPISWETSMGGPLGEVLNSTSTTPKDCSKNSTTSALNLMTEGWDASPRLESSPTGVLQKTTFGSLSNSSTGSSPRAENSNKVHENNSLCDDLLGSTLVNSSAISSL